MVGVIEREVRHPIRNARRLDTHLAANAAARSVVSFMAIRFLAAPAVCLCRSTARAGSRSEHTIPILPQASCRALHLLDHLRASRPPCRVVVLQGFGLHGEMVSPARDSLGSVGINSRTGTWSVLCGVAFPSGMRSKFPNHWLQATRDCAVLSGLAHWSRVPEPKR